MPHKLDRIIKGIFEFYEYREKWGLPKEFSWTWIQSPFSRKQILLFRYTENEFYKIASEVINSDRHLQGRVSSKTLGDALKWRLARDILELKRPLCNKTYDRIISKAKKYVRSQKMRTLTIAKPVLINKDGGPTFSVGPVKFMTVEKFFKQYNHWLDEHRTAVIQRSMKHEKDIALGHRPRLIDKDEKWPLLSIYRYADMYKNELSTYFRSSKWVAVAQVRNYDEEKGTEVADTLIRTALGILKIPLESTHGSKISLPGNFRPQGKSSHIKYISGAPSISLHIQSETEIFSAEELENLLKTDFWHYVSSSGFILHLLEEKAQLPVLHQRLHDSIHWYSEGVSDEFYHNRIVKFCNSLESLLCTSQNNLVDQLRFRGAYVCSFEDPFAEWITWFKKINEVYDIRSRIVHGNRPPFQADDEAIAWKAENVSRRAIVGGIEFTRRLSVNAEKTNLAYIDNFFRNFPEDFWL